MQNVQELFGKRKFGRFVKENWRLSPYSRPCSAAPFIDFLNFEDLDYIRKQGLSTIKIVNNFSIVRSTRKTSNHYLEKQFRHKNSIVIRHAEASHPKLKKLAENFQETFQSKVDLQIFVTPELEETFPWHYDPEEVFIIQTSGEKEYFLRENTVNPHPTVSNMPVDLQYEKERSTLFLSCRLQQGDWLYIPKGWWHKARALKESMHMSIGMS